MIRAVLVATLLLHHATLVRAGPEARSYMDRVLSRTSWKDMQGQVVLSLINKRGGTKVREMQLWSKKNAAEETSMLMRFVKPADVRGTGFLLVEHKRGEDDRRLFLPALRRVQRISASGSGGNFMSSDFTFYDVGRPRLADWTYTFAGEKPVAGIKCKVVQGRAASAKVRSDTGYTKVVWYVDPSRLVVLAADYYDKSGRRLKVMRAKKIEKISGAPFATHIRMEDVTTGHASEMVFQGLKTNQGLPEQTFTERNLRKWTR